MIYDLNYRVPFQKIQKAGLLDFISDAILKRDFEWAFDLYTVFFVLFPGEYQLALKYIFNLLSENKIINIEFETFLSNFTIEKLHLVPSQAKTTFEFILDLFEKRKVKKASRFLDLYIDSKHYKSEETNEIPSTIHAIISLKNKNLKTSLDLFEKIFNERTHTPDFVYSCISFMDQEIRKHLKLH